MRRDELVLGAHAEAVKPRMEACALRDLGAVAAGIHGDSGANLEPALIARIGDAARDRVAVPQDVPKGRSADDSGSRGGGLCAEPAIEPAHVEDAKTGLGRRLEGGTR